MSPISIQNPQMRIFRIPLRRALAAAFTLLAACAPNVEPSPATAATAAGPPAATTAGPAAPVVLDGSLAEWEGVAPAVVDPADGRAPYPDLLAVHTRAGADAVYLALTVREPVSLQGLPGPLLLLVDTDPGGATGREVFGMPGVDASLDFSGGPGFGAGGGVWLRRTEAAGTADSVVSANAAGLMIAPSHAARRFEMRIPRGGSLRVDGRMAFRFVALDSAGAVMDRTDVVTRTFAHDGAPPPSRGAGAADPLARAPGTDLRVVSWNVGRGTFFTSAQAYRDILRGLAPDLLMLDEVPGDRTLAQVEEALNGPVPGERPWRAFYGTSGGTQRGVIAVRGSAPARGAPAFAGVVPYPDSARTILRRLDANSRDTLYHTRTGVPVTGAVVEIGGRRLLAVAVDLESGGRPGDERDRLRIIEAHVIRDALAAALRADSVDGVLVSGDLNLVASPDPLVILAAGPDVDGSALHVPLPLRLDGASAATWEDSEQPFTPGRLDFILVGDATLAVTDAFVFHAGDLSPEWRARHGVSADASAVTDHLPLVTDLRWLGPRR